MREQYPVDTDAAAGQPTAALAGPARHARDEGRSEPAAMRRRWAVLAWTAGAIAIFALFLKISFTKGVDSDGANNALQAWDMLHGHILLHGWIIGDATYYTFELPVIAVVEIFFGLQNFTMGVAEAVIYLIVAAWAIAIAVRGSSGMSRGVRAAVVVAVLAAPAVLISDMWIPLGIPDHTGTTVFLLIPCLLIDRVPGRRYIPPLLCVILAAGQIGDVTVRYVAVPAIVLACAYRALAARRLLTADGANLLAAGLSVPLALGVRALMLNYGSYLMVAPKTKIAPIGTWAHNASLTWGAIRMVYGAQPGPQAAPVGAATIFGYACLVISALGILRVLCRWRTASRAEQALAAAIAANIAVYILSTLPAANSPHDIVAILPSGAVLAARTLVPQRISSRVVAAVATVFAMAAVVLPLEFAGSEQQPQPSLNVVGAWLKAHGLTYGLGGYWDGSAISVETRNQVAVRTVQRIHTLTGPGVAYYAWETNVLWYDPTRYYANFLLVNAAGSDMIDATAASVFGKPDSTHFIGQWEVLVYSKNLLTDLTLAPLPPTN